MSLSTEWHGLLFDIRRSIRYHNRRRAFYDQLDQISNMLSVIFGSAAIYGVMESNVNMKPVALVAAGLVTVLSAVNLVLGSALKGRAHADFSRQFIELEKKMVLNDPSDDLLRSITAERLTLEAEEPPVLRVLDCICHNEQLRAMGYSSEQMSVIGPCQALFAPFFDFCADKIKPPEPKSNP